ncbi:MAG TPA: alpha/beta fold hydrolase [Gemmatimonadaceae bacterium]|nr:alpha/beta fold hydrolase [Gemmatimonadaceae bacterium]
MMRSSATLLAFALIIGVPSGPLLSAAQPVVPDQTSTDAVFEPEPCPFWSAEESAQYRVECGRLIVPESERGGRRYRLQVAILRSLRERLHNDAIVLIPGGPGGHLVRGDAARLARHPLQDALRQHRDIVLMDPRGTGYSEPGELCPAFEGLETRAAILRLPVGEASAFIRRALADCRTRLQEQGIDPEQFNSVALARDLEGLRRALGHDQLNLIGFSWGTRVALETMRRFPESVRSAILYSPLPPDGWASGTTAARVGPSMERLFAACAGDQRCRRSFPSLEEEFRAALAELDADPIRLSTEWGPFDVDGAVAQTVISYALYDSDFLPYIPLAIRELRRRNAAFVEMLLQPAMGAGSSGGFYYTARCFDLVPQPPADSLQRLRERFPWLGSFNRFAPEPAAVCDAFMARSPDSTVFQPVRSEVPTLIFAGEFDPTTPLEYGRRAAATLPNAYLVALRGRGHDVNVPTPCTVQIREQFLGNPLQSLDTSCVGALPPLSFATNVHVNAAVPRLTTRVAVAREPVWLIALGLPLLFLLVGTFLLPVSWLAGRHSGRGRGAALATGLLWAATATSLLFAAGLVLALWTAGDPYQALFGVPDRWGWLFALPPIALVFAAGGALALGLAWRRAGWSRRERVLHAVVAAASAGFVLLVGWIGMLPRA